MTPISSRNSRKTPKSLNTSSAVNSRNSVPLTSTSKRSTPALSPSGFNLEKNLFSAATPVESRTTALRLLTQKARAQPPHNGLRDNDAARSRYHKELRRRPTL